MLTNAVETTPILYDLKQDIQDENKWIRLISCQTTGDSQLQVLFRAAATLPHSLPIWTQLVQKTVSLSTNENSLKVLHEALLRFPNNVDFWKLAFRLSPSIETFSSALTKIDNAHVWPYFLQFLAETSSIEANARAAYFADAVNGGACTLEELFTHLSQQPEMYTQMLLQLKPSQWELWQPVLYSSALFESACVHSGSAQSLLETALTIFGTDREEELVVKVAGKLRHRFREARSILVYFLEHAHSVRSYCRIFQATTDLYEFEIDRNAASLLVPGRWSTNQMLLTEFRNVLQKRALQLNNIAIKEDPNNVGLWLERARLHQKRPHVAADVMEKAIETIDFYRQHNGDIVSLYTEYSNLLLDNGSGQEKALEPINKCLQLRMLTDNQKAKLYMALVHVQSSRNLNSALKTLESALKNPSLKHIRPSLWMRYFELVTGEDKILAAFGRCCLQLDVTPRIVLQVAKLLKHPNRNNQLAVFEKGVAVFPPPYSLPLWIAYMDSIAQSTDFKGSDAKQMLSDLRIVFERAILTYAHNLSAAEKLISVYGRIELDCPRGSVLNVRRAVQRVLSQTRSRQVWQLYVQSFVDIDGKRAAYERAIKQLDDVDASAMALEMASFEEKLQELQRCQELYQYAARLHRSSETLSAWQQFERRNEIKLVDFVPQN